MEGGVRSSGGGPQEEGEVVMVDVPPPVAAPDQHQPAPALNAMAVDAMGFDALPAFDDMQDMDPAAFAAVAEAAAAAAAAGPVEVLAAPVDPPAVAMAAEELPSPVQEQAPPHEQQQEAPAVAVAPAVEEAAPAPEAAAAVPVNACADDAYGGAPALEPPAVAAEGTNGTGGDGSVPPPAEAADEGAVAAAPALAGKGEAGAGGETWETIPMQAPAAGSVAPSIPPPPARTAPAAAPMEEGNCAADEPVKPEQPQEEAEAPSAAATDGGKEPTDGQQEQQEQEQQAPPPQAQQTPVRLLDEEEAAAAAVVKPQPRQRKRTAHEAYWAKYQRTRKSSTRRLPGGLAGVATLSGADFEEDVKEMGRVRTQRPPGVPPSSSEEEEWSSEEGEAEGASGMGYAEEDFGPLPPLAGGRYRAPYGSKRPYNRRGGGGWGKGGRGSGYGRGEEESEEEEDDEMLLMRGGQAEMEAGPVVGEDIPILPLPVEFVVAEAERQGLDTQYRSVRSTMVRTAQEAQAQGKLKGHAVKALQSLCWREAQLLSVRRRKIRVLQDIILAFRKRRAVASAMEGCAASLRKAAGLGEGGEDEMEEDEVDESEEEEDEEEPVLKFEDEPLEANEVVIMPDGSEGVVEGIRRGNVVVRTENGVMETFKLEEVKRKHVAPPGYVRPEKAKTEDGEEVPQIITKDLLKAWEALEERFSRAEKEAERGVKESLEALYQESGLDAILHRSDKDYEAESAFAASTGAASTTTAAAGATGSAPGSGVKAKKRGDANLPVRPILFTSAPRGPVPFDVPLIVTPLVPLPDHALAAVHIKDLGELRRTGAPDEGKERVCDRVLTMREQALSAPLREWEQEKAEHSALKAEVVKLETLVRRQKQQTDEVRRWMSNEGAAATMNKLRNQLASLGGDMDNLRLRQRIELQIAAIPIPEGDEQFAKLYGTQAGAAAAALKAVDVGAMLTEAAELGAGGGVLEDEEEREEAEKKRRLAEEEAEEEAEMAAQEAAEEAAQAAAEAEQPGYPMRSRSASLRGRGASLGGELGEGSDEDEEGAGAMDEVAAAAVGGLLAAAMAAGSGGGDGGTATGSEAEGADEMEEEDEEEDEDGEGESGDEEEEEEEEGDEEEGDEDGGEEEEEEDGGGNDLEAVEALLASARGSLSGPSTGPSQEAAAEQEPDESDSARGGKRPTRRGSSKPAAAEEGGNNGVSSRRSSAGSSKPPPAAAKPPSTRGGGAGRGGRKSAGARGEESDDAASSVASEQYSSSGAGGVKRSAEAMAAAETASVSSAGAGEGAGKGGKSGAAASKAKRRKR